MVPIALQSVSNICTRSLSRSALYSRFIIGGHFNSILTIFDDLRQYVVKSGSLLLAFLPFLDLRAWYVMNGLKLQTGRPLSCDICKSLFKNSLCFIHCIVPTLPPLYSRRQIFVNLMLVLYRPSVSPVRSFTLVIIIEMYRF